MPHTQTCHSKSAVFTVTASGLAVNLTLTHNKLAVFTVRDINTQLLIFVDFFVI